MFSLRSFKGAWVLSWNRIHHRRKESFIYPLFNPTNEGPILKKPSNLSGGAGVEAYDEWSRDGVADILDKWSSKIAAPDWQLLNGYRVGFGTQNLTSSNRSLWCWEDTSKGGANVAETECVPRDLSFENVRMKLTDFDLVEKRKNVDSPRTVPDRTDRTATRHWWVPRYLWERWRQGTIVPRHE